MAKDKKRYGVTTLLPVVFFVGLAFLFVLSLSTSRDRQKIPSVLLGKPLPQISLPFLEGALKDKAQIPALNAASLIDPDVNKGRVIIVNIWASWCGPCRQEHPFFMELSNRSDLLIVGVNYKDQNKQALKFLNALGNPYDVIGVDPNGRAAIELGVYGIPETFIVSPQGKVIFKHVGPIVSEDEKKKILQEIAAAHQKK